MIQLLIGHRGAGKSRLLSILKNLDPELGSEGNYIDLDKAIEAYLQMSISEYFKKNGEAQFRQLEVKIFNQLIEQALQNHQSLTLALGAGFLGPLPNELHTVWVRRKTDAQGRSFIHRPRLEPQLSPLEEYFHRYEERKPRFRQMCHEQWTELEGFSGPQLWHQIFWQQNTKMPAAADLSLQKRHVSKLCEFIKKFEQCGFRYLELRDDVVTLQQCQSVFAEIASLQTLKPLFSFRSQLQMAESQAWLRAQTKNFIWDWPLEFGPCPWGTPSIVSRHQRHENLAATLTELESYSSKSLLKLAIEIGSFSELAQAHTWWLKDPSRRAFLPCSSNGRWQWYRQLFGGFMPLQFIREGDSQNFDQPLFADWVRVQHTMRHYRDPRELRFAAVLGHPIEHSQTPAEQGTFFSKYHLPVVSIELNESEWVEGINCLRSLGLIAAAVTAPLKRQAYLFSQPLDSESQGLEAVNTLVFKQKWFSTNTDRHGLSDLLNSQQLSEPVFVWGGGGTKSILQRTLPQAQFCTPRELDAFLSDHAQPPNTLIWAVGRGRHKVLPPQHWKPQKIIDLNYSEDSPGLELAVQLGCEYESGMNMFRTQAHWQRVFWQKQFADFLADSMVEADTP